MNLELLEIKLKEIDLKLEIVRDAFKYNTDLVLDGLKTIDLNDPTRNIFAKYDFMLKGMLPRIKDVTNELNIYHKHKTAISSKTENIKKGLELLSSLEDDIINILTTLQSIAVYLENLLRD